MAGASLFTLLDDIASLLDDVAVLSKVAINKTAGVLGDDLALNAKQVTGLSADRELPVVFRVALGSSVNKLILIPAALIISWLAPWAITPLLMIGGIFLCYEGVEKLLHAFLHPEPDSGESLAHAIADPEVDIVKFERDKITGAIRTDFILSAEIIVITLGTLKGQSFWVTLGVLSAVGVIMTIGVYGLVGAIVKLDDLGLKLYERRGNSRNDAILRNLGSGILWFAPYLLRGLSIAGTAAMFLVGGGIITHNVDWFHDLNEKFVETLHLVPVLGNVLGWIGPFVFDAMVGVIAGALVVMAVLGIKHLVFRAPKNKVAH